MATNLPAFLFRHLLPALSRFVLCHGCFLLLLISGSLKKTLIIIIIGTHRCGQKQQYGTKASTAQTMTRRYADAVASGSSVVSWPPGKFLSARCPCFHDVTLVHLPPAVIEMTAVTRGVNRNPKFRNSEMVRIPIRYRTDNS